jgi:hypothetical protein
VEGQAPSVQSGRWTTDVSHCECFQVDTSVIIAGFRKINDKRVILGSKYSTVLTSTHIREDQRMAGSLQFQFLV